MINQYDKIERFAEVINKKATAQCKKIEKQTAKIRKKQLAEIAKILCGETPYDEAALADKDNYLYAHRFMIKELLSAGVAKDEQEAEKRVTDKVNDVCRNILLNTAVFKKDENGVKGFDGFLASVGIERK